MAPFFSSFRRESFHNMQALAMIAVVLGLVEGVTEFLPVSSTGHLILVARGLGFEGSTAHTFEVFIQLGAILAVVAAYPARFGRLLDLRDREGFAGMRGLGLLAVSTAPALVLGALAHDAIKQYLFTPLTVAVGLAVGGLWILVTERVEGRRGQTGIDTLSWGEALAVGLFQCLALWPGMSRSASTILGGMMSGLDRRTATEYSFFTAVPTLFAACAFDLFKSLPELSTADIPLFAVGFVVAFLSAWVAVKFFVRFLSRHTLIPFGWYRMVLAAVVFWLVR